MASHTNALATTLTSKGQVTIPKHIRDSLKMKPGCKLIFDVSDDGRVYLARKSDGGMAKPDRFERLIGSAEIKLGCSVDEYMAMIRGYDEDDPGLRK